MLTPVNVSVWPMLYVISHNVDISEPPQSFIFLGTNKMALLLYEGLIKMAFCVFTKGTLTIESEHPVSETRYAHRFVFIPKEHKHHFQTPTFREPVNWQIKAVVAGIKNERYGESERSILKNCL